ncbi:hypothetical protein CL617_04970 [archaeon]|nr:hypothetical protein [archaeon]
MQKINVLEKILNEMIDSKDEIEFQQLYFEGMGIAKRKSSVSTRYYLRKFQQLYECRNEKTSIIEVIS